MMKVHTAHELFNEDLPYCRPFENIFENDGADQVVLVLVEMAEDDPQLRELLYSGEYITIN